MQTPRSPRMPRVYTYYDRNGRGHHNLDRLRIPFRLMEHVGDWCEVEAGPTCLAGNVTTLCSIYSQKLGRRFKFKDMKDGTFRITVMATPVKPKKPAKRPGSIKVARSVAS